MNTKKLYCDGIFEGGGVKGIGFAGAVRTLEEAGYAFRNVVGTSAGAIAAALLAVGYTGAEMEAELMKVDFRKFAPRSFRPISSTVRLFFRYGLHKADPFEEWFGGLLERKGKKTFGDIRTGSDDLRYRYAFQAIASNLTDRRIMILPHDMEQFGIAPDDFPIATAVRMSMSIPLFYQPYRLTVKEGMEHLIVDGGLLSNYPVWLLDRENGVPRHPTFGFKFISGGDRRHHSPVHDEINNFPEYIRGLIGTMMEYGDSLHISESNGDLQRSILIPTTVPSRGGERQIHATHFAITDEENRAMVENGRRAAAVFLAKWDFDKWVQEFRR